MSLVGELGERKIIEIILGCLDQMPNMPIPFGDDVSAVDIGNEKLAVIKTDMLVGKTDVPPGMNLWQAARKAVVMNISDLAAKGVNPPIFNPTSLLATTRRFVIGCCATMAPVSFNATIPTRSL